MTTPDEPEIGILFHGVPLSAADFRLERLHDHVAWQIALALATHCADKAAALELLRATAGDVIGQVAATFAEHMRRNAARKAAEKN